MLPQVWALGNFRSNKRWEHCQIDKVLILGISDVSDSGPSFY